MAQRKDGRSIERLNYERYFKHYYRYSPSLIRANNISSLQIWSKHFWEDSLTMSYCKQKISYHKNGYPIHMVEYTDYGRDSTFTDYYYDSLGRLTHYHQWKSALSYGSGKHIPIDVMRIHYEYENDLLQKVFQYSKRYSSSYISLRQCDSISYELKDNYYKVSVHVGNGQNRNVLYPKKNKYIYPIRNSNSFFASHVSLPHKPADDDSLWSEPCIYRDSNLITIQNILGGTCLSRDLELRVKGQNGFLFSGTLESFEKPGKLTYAKDEFESDCSILIDTNENLIKVKSESIMSEPTSLENRITHDQSLYQFNFKTQLIRKESTVSSSRGERESNTYKTTHTYNYFDFGLVKEKIERRYQLFLPNQSTTIVLDRDKLEFEEKESSRYEERMEVVYW